jgi:hypothetical protein
VGAKFRIPVGSAVIAAAALTATGCGDMATESRAPVQLTIMSLTAASGAQPDDLSGTLRSDVITNVQQTVNGQQVEVPTIFNDNGSVTFALILKNPGGPVSPSEPSLLNQVTVTRYRVVYRRTDGRNTPGVDVPYPFDSAFTVTVPADGTVTSGFQIVRHSAKQEAPLRALAFNPDIISTIADVTFYGQDQVGNEVSAVGTIGIDFGNFGDPE